MAQFDGDGEPISQTVSVCATSRSVLDSPMVGDLRMCSSRIRHLTLRPLLLSLKNLNE